MWKLYSADMDNLYLFYYYDDLERVKVISGFQKFEIARIWNFNYE